MQLEIMKNFISSVLKSKKFISITVTYTISLAFATDYSCVVF